MTDVAVDGRVARGNRTREAVIEALFDLYAEGNLTPTIEDIAERQLARYPELFNARPITGTLAERIDGIVHHRAELFETVAPSRRSALVRMHASPELQSQQQLLTTHLRKQLTRTFEPEPSTLERSPRAETVALLDLHTSWNTWDRLRTSQKLSVKRSRNLVTDLVTSALER